MRDNFQDVMHDPRAVAAVAAALAEDFGSGDVTTKALVDPRVVATGEVIAREVAATGVDAISLGCLTHSAKAVDLSLEWSVV